MKPRRQRLGILIDSMNVFFDTEFSGLNSDPRLLSIGLVADTGEELYIEFVDGWAEENCSSWVLEHVVPMLGNGERLTRTAAASRISSWLSSLAGPSVLLGETDWDTGLVTELMMASGVKRDHFQIKELKYDGKAQADAFNAARQRYFDSKRVSPHHALVDARAFKHAWHRVFSATKTPTHDS